MSRQKEMLDQLLTEINDLLNNLFYRTNRFIEEQEWDQETLGKIALHFIDKDVVLHHQFAKFIVALSNRKYEPLTTAQIKLFASGSYAFKAKDPQPTLETVINYLNTTPFDQIMTIVDDDSVYTRETVIELRESVKELAEKYGGFTPLEWLLHQPKPRS